MGDDQPWPVIGVFQATFLVVLHSTGTLLPAYIPWPVGPRNSGQFSARAEIQMPKKTITANKRAKRRMVGSRRVGGRAEAFYERPPLLARCNRAESEPCME